MFSFFKKLRIGTKITMIVLSVVLLSVAIVSFFAYNQSKTTIKDRYLEAMNVVADLKVQKIETFFSEVRSSIQMGQSLNAVRQNLRDAEKKPIKSNEEKDAKEDKKIDPKKETKTEAELDLDADLSVLDIPQDTSTTTNPDQQKINTQGGQESIDFGFQPELENAIITIQSVYKLNNIYLVDKNGVVRYIANDQISNQKVDTKFEEPKADPNILNRGKDTLYFSKVFLQQVQNRKKYVILASAPVLDDADATGKNTLGTLIYEVDMSKIDTLANDRVGLGETGEVFLLQEQDKGQIKYVNSTKNQQGKTRLPLETADSKANEKGASILQRAVQKGSPASKGLEEGNYLAVSRYIPAVDWGVVVKVNSQEIYRPAEELLRKFLIAGLITIFITFVFGIIFSQYLIQPLTSLRKTVEALGRGELPPRVKAETEDEIGDMTNQINELVQNLYNTANFAKRIGEKDFDAEFKPASTSDILGNSLLTMRDSIIESAEKDDKSKWILSAESEIGNILRTEEDLQALGEKVLKAVVDKVGAVQGAFYVTKNDDEGVQKDNQDPPYLEMFASYAYNKKKYLNAKFNFAEGLIGQAAVERDLIMRTEIPDSYMTISSGLLGENKPKCLLVMPLITNEKVYGVMEIAGFDRFNERETEFVVKISDIIARAIFNIKTSENRQRLLNESQRLNTTLSENQVALQKNADEILEGQQKLKVVNKNLETQIQNVENEQRKTQILLENASEVITIYEKNGVIRYVSPSVTKILGYDAEEMIGKSDSENIEQEERAGEFSGMFKALIDFPDEKKTIRFKYRKKDGDSIWLEATGINLLSDPIINGIVLNTRDITERRRAEREERMRGQMQALSENSPDLIARLSKEGTVYYINPVIENYTGFSKEKYLQKVITPELLDDTMVKHWFNLIERVSRRGEKDSKDVQFKSKAGDRNMKVTVIPERNEDGNTESFLVVSNDITDQKLQQAQLENANKKVKDSINYAKRIQDSILPDSGIIESTFADSFIFFRPKDIVSGDFPWMVSKGDCIYIAVVDCTGHGVPGALMSLIGYFLLKNILDTNENPTAGLVLDLLDEQVTETLRQGTGDGSSKDGMDVSLCKIDLKNGTIEYAGAHRPLYYVDVTKKTDDNLEEIKGDKFPIGGAQYRNRTTFTNTLIKYNKGDMVFLFSDGLPDQFGGPDNRKFSPKRIRDTIKLHQSEKMSEISTAIEKELMSWMKGDDIKQTDDILMIGIRF